MKAYLKNYRQSPRKVRLVANLIKGKNTKLALSELDFLPKRAGLPIKKLLLSAIANAVNLGISKDDLFIKELRVDKGIVMKRMMPAAMGTGHRINKRTSHITLILAEKVMPTKETKKSNKNVLNKITKVVANKKVAKPKVSKIKKQK
jgi:large subunit ribosomal protein L22